MISTAGGPGESEFAARAREDIANGADLIKVCVTGWPGDAYRYPDSVRSRNPELAAVVKEARAASKKVVAHAIGRRGASMAVAAGVDALVHSAFVDSATLALMKQRGIYLIPTLTSFQGDKPRSLLFRNTCGSVLASGIPIAMGTDAGVTPHGQNAAELQAMVEAGMSPLAAVRSATIDAATLLGISEKAGTLTPGKFADLIAVAGNPLEDARLMQHVVFVIKAGRIYLTP